MYHSSVAVDGAGNVYVADTDNYRIQKFDSAGGFLAKWGSNGRGDGQFHAPYGVAVDASGNVYVADPDNYRIQKFNVALPDIGVTDSVAPANDLQIPFGEITLGNTSEQTVTVTNNGAATLVLGTVASANPLAAPFSIPADTCTGQSIAPAGSCTLTIRFAPTASGSFTDSFDIPSNDLDTPTVTVLLTGTGLSTVVNNPPSKPEMVSPANGQTGLPTTVTFRWKPSTDPEGEPVTYDLYYCADSGFTGCGPIQVASVQDGHGVDASRLAYGTVLLLFGGILAGINRKGRRVLLLALVVITGTILISCGSGGGGGPKETPTTDMTYTVSGLERGTTYYWKVVVKDGQGGQTESDTFHFTTQ